MRKFIIAIIAAMLFSSAPVMAFDTVDIAQLECSDAMTDGESFAAILIWLDGYISAKSGDTNMSEAWITKLGEHLAIYCSQHPDDTIMQAVNALPR